MEPCLIDTDVFSYMFKADARGTAMARRIGTAQMHLSFMTVAELLRWTLARGWGESRKRQLHESIGRCVIVPYHAGVVEAWARITDERSRGGRPIACGDCWIAATSVVHKLPLVTNNKSDFAGIAGLRVIQAE